MRERSVINTDGAVPAMTLNLKYITVSLHASAMFVYVCLCVSACVCVCLRVFAFICVRLHSSAFICVLKIKPPDTSRHNLRFASGHVFVEGFRDALHMVTSRRLGIHAYTCTYIQTYKPFNKIRSYDAITRTRYDFHSSVLLHVLI